MPSYVPGGGNALPGLQYPIIAQPIRTLAGPRKRSAVGRDIRLHALFLRTAAGQANTASYCWAAGGVAFCLSFAILS